MKTRYALDENGKTVHISETHNKNNYYCLSCNEKLILKKGEINAHHFAHIAGSQCSDNWNYDMSEWHEEWQNRFPKENREVVLASNGEKHRADVLIDNTVIEFQHSSLSSHEFERRNDFYLSLGYNIIWIFDVADLYESGAIEPLDDSDVKYKWRRPFKTFDYFNPKNKMIELWLQITYEDEEHIEEWGESNICLIKVDWIAPTGMERFVANSCVGVEYILNKFFPQKKEQLDPEKICDWLYPHYDRDHTTYMYGCPLSKTHYAISSTIDTPSSKYDKYKPCELCEFSLHHRGNFACKQRFEYLERQIPNDSQILKIARTHTGRVTDIAIQHNEKRYVTKIPDTLPPLEDTILNVWKNVNPRNVLILKNVKTNVFVKIAKRHKTTLENSGKCYGYVSKDQYNFSDEEREIYYSNSPEWVWTWYK